MQILFYVWSLITKSGKTCNEWLSTYLGAYSTYLGISRISILYKDVQIL